MNKYCLLLCLLLSVSGSLVNEAPKHYELTWEFYWPHTNFNLCAFNPNKSIHAPPRVVSAFIYEDTEYWEVGTSTPIPIEPSGPATSCSVSTMQLQDPQPSLCFGLATLSGNDTCKIYCDRGGLPMRLLEWDCDDDARAIDLQHFTGCTLIGLADWSTSKVQLLRQYDGQDILTPFQNITGWVAPHEITFLSHEEYSVLKQPYLVVADLGGHEGGFGNLVIVPLDPNCGGTAGAMFTADEPNARNVVVMAVEDALLLYVATHTKPYVAVYRFDGIALTRVDQINTLQSETLAIAICKKQLFVGGTGGDITVFRLDDVGGGVMSDILPAPETVAITAYLDEQERCQVTVAAHTGGVGPHYQEKLDN